MGKYNVVEYTSPLSYIITISEITLTASVIAIARKDIGIQIQKHIIADAYYNSAPESGCDS